MSENRFPDDAPIISCPCCHASTRFLNANEPRQVVACEWCGAEAVLEHRSWGPVVLGLASNPRILNSPDFALVPDEGGNYRTQWRPAMSGEKTQSLVPSALLAAARSGMNEAEAHYAQTSGLAMPGPGAIAEASRVISTFLRIYAPAWKWFNGPGLAAEVEDAATSSDDMAVFLAADKVWVAAGWARTADGWRHPDAKFPPPHRPGDLPCLPSSALANPGVYQALLDYIAALAAHRTAATPPAPAARRDEVAPAPTLADKLILAMAARHRGTGLETKVAAYLGIACPYIMLDLVDLAAKWGTPAAELWPWLDGVEI